MVSTKKWNQAYLIQFYLTILTGGVTENFEFAINDDTEVLNSCSALLNGEIFVFGGYYEPKQVIEAVSIF